MGWCCRPDVVDIPALARSLELRLGETESAGAGTGLGFDPGGASHQPRHRAKAIESSGAFGLL